jgi:hypothetical protein
MINRAGTQYSEQDILNYSFNSILEKLQFVPALQDPTKSSTTAYREQMVNGGLAEVRLDYDVDSNPIYVGLAHPDTATSSDEWLIRKLTFSSGNLTRVQIATGSWDSRITLF